MKGERIVVGKNTKRKKQNKRWKDSCRKKIQ